MSSHPGKILPVWIMQPIIPPTNYISYPVGLFIFLKIEIGAACRDWLVAA